MGLCSGYVCMYAQVQVCRYGCMDTWCTYMYQLEANLGVGLRPLPPQASHWPVTLPLKQSQLCCERPAPSLLFSCYHRIAGTNYWTLLPVWVQVLMPGRQALHHLIHLLKPKFLFFMKSHAFGRPDVLVRVTTAMETTLRQSSRTQACRVHGLQTAHTPCCG